MVKATFFKKVKKEDYRRLRGTEYVQIDSNDIECSLNGIKLENTKQTMEKWFRAYKHLLFL